MADTCATQQGVVDNGKNDFVKTDSVSTRCVHARYSFCNFRTEHRSEGNIFYLQQRTTLSASAYVKLIRRNECGSILHLVPTPYEPEMELSSSATMQAEEPSAALIPRNGVTIMLRDAWFHSSYSDPIINKMLRKISPLTLKILIPGLKDAGCPSYFPDCMIALNLQRTLCRSMGLSFKHPQTLNTRSAMYRHFEHIVFYHFNSVCLRRTDSCSLTYSKCLLLVDELASILHHRLKIVPGSRIGLWMNGSFEYVISILAVLKLMAVFVPLDVELPMKRLELMEKQASLAMILTNHRDVSTQNMLSFFSAPVISFQIQDGARLEISSFDRTVQSQPQAGCEGGYIIFTSGSTGNPKGVLIDESSLLNMAIAQIHRFGIQPDDIVAQFASICFDASLSEIFMALLAGASLLLFPSRVERAGSVFIHSLNACSVSVLTLSPSLLISIDPILVPSIRVIVSAGEPCPQVLAKKWLGHGRRFFNAYGPSETAVCATIYEFNTDNLPEASENETVPIGTPIEHVKIRVVDSKLDDVFAGMPGELLIAGKGVSNFGYVNKTNDLPQPSFITCNEERWYRTGDLVKYLGPTYRSLMYLGRMDNQVKLRGCRIELHEIEAFILRFSNVNHCVVVLHRCKECDGEQGCLVAYVDGQTTSTSLQMSLTASLPSYMQPRYILLRSFSTLPKTFSGKTDRKSLASDESIHLRLTTVEALSTTEQKLLELWRNVLNKQKDNCQMVHTNAITFAEFGGDSLMIALLYSLLNKTFVRTIYIHPNMSLKDMAASVDETKDEMTLNTYTKISEDLKMEFTNPVFQYPLSKTNKISSILLTGATGLVGCFLLNELLRTTLTNVILLIRARTLAEAHFKLRATLQKYDLYDEAMQSIFQHSLGSHVHIALCGNLSDADEVSENSDLDALWDRIDAVIHCAADTNFNMTYEHLRGVNVLFTKYVIHKCWSHGIHLYYISSLSIFLFTDLTNRSTSSPIVTERDQPVLSHIVGGYAQSKYVADTLALACLSRGLPGAIFRLGRITGSSLSGVGATEDLFIRMLRGCQQLRAYPNLTFPFDLTPVDQVSRTIVKLIEQEKPSTNSNPLVVHLVNRQKIPFNEQFGLIRKFGLTSCDLEPLSYSDWYKRLERNCLNSLRQANKCNALTPLLPFLRSSFWNFADQWPYFAETAVQDALIDVDPVTLFNLYCNRWKGSCLIDS